MEFNGDMSDDSRREVILTDGIFVPKPLETVGDGTTRIHTGRYSLHYTLIVPYAGDQFVVMTDGLWTVHPSIWNTDDGDYIVFGGDAAGVTGGGGETADMNGQRRQRTNVRADRIRRFADKLRNDSIPMRVVTTLQRSQLIGRNCVDEFEHVRFLPSYVNVYPISRLATKNSTVFRIPTLYFIRTNKVDVEIMVKFVGSIRAAVIYFENVLISPSTGN